MIRPSPQASTVAASCSIPATASAKPEDNNYPLLAQQNELLTLGQPILAGVSRKSFLGRTLARTISLATDSPDAPPDFPPHARGNATLAAITAAILAGASIVRVHDVRPAVEAARIADAILSAL